MSEIRPIYKRRQPKTNNFSFRDVARLAIVDEGKIIQKRSPLPDGNLAADIANTSTLKMLITVIELPHAHHLHVPPLSSLRPRRLRHGLRLGAIRPPNGGATHEIAATFIKYEVVLAAGRCEQRRISRSRFLQSRNVERTAEKVRKATDLSVKRPFYRVDLSPR
ncbi:hypothetical protein [Bradyrhizobium sp. WSM1253]|uniref:hypothetical protein n=1 Tax=Bradyrhizobium sp. WSM1253 TaxID=319003 RepID=UPI0012F4D42B|nr:hypothetical protein [Bradyrhizobium sp. WSM1253]